MRNNNYAIKPIKIGNVTAKNRFYMPSMVTNYGNPDGTVSEKLINFLKMRANGGAGVICTEAVIPEDNSLCFTNMLRMDDDKYIPQMRKLVDAIHTGDTLACLQLGHAGRQATPEVSKMDMLAPSAIPYADGAAVPKEMTVEDIKNTIKQFADAAERGLKAGFDIIEIHGGHGYLIDSFLSPWSNRRTDEYGGSFENRARFPLELVDAIRERVGDDFPLVYRLNSDDFQPNRWTPEDAAEFSKLLVEHGINAINVTGGNYKAGHIMSGPEDEFCFYADNAALIKKAINSAVPVIVANRIRTPEHIEKVLSEGKADMVALGRPMIVDPDYVNKLKNGQVNDIRYCTSCNYCIDQIHTNQPLGCLYNPLVGKEYEYDLNKKADKPKKLVVVGGGPAGMEAAYVAAMLGHDVVLFEKNNYLGGNVVPGIKPPYKEIGYVIDYLTHQLEKYNVDVRINTGATVTTILNEKPDAVFIATGSTPVKPNIPGIDNKNICFAEDILMDKVTPGKNTVIIGGGSVGIETGELLVRKGCNVTVVEMQDDVLTDLGPNAKFPLLARALETMKINTGETVKEITANSVVTDKKEYKEVDTVVIAVGYQALDNLSARLEESGIDAMVIGDAVEARKINQAIQEGFEAAYSL